VGIGVLPEIFVVGVGMGVEMDHPDRPLLGDGAHGWQGGQVIAANSKRDGAGRNHSSDAGLDLIEAVQEIDRVHGEIADVGHIGDREGFRSRDMMDAPHQARLASHLSWPMARARAVRGAAVPRDAVERDVETLGARRQRQPHERGDSREPRNQRSVDGLMSRRSVGHRENSWRTARSMPATMSSRSQRPFSADDPAVSESAPEAGTSPGGRGKRS
jgi:hypothetical protein